MTGGGRRSASIPRASSRSARTATRQGSGYDQADEYPVRADDELQRGQPRRLCSAATPRARRGMAAAGCCRPANRNLRWSFQDDLSWTRGRHNFKFGFYAEWASKTEPQSTGLHGELCVRAQRRRIRSARATAMRTRSSACSTLHGADQPGRPRPPALADRRVSAGQLAREPAADARLRRAADPQRRLLRYAPVDGRLLRAELGSEAGAAALPRRCARRACRATRPARRTTSGRTIRRNPSVLLPSAFIGNLVPGTGSQINGMVADGYPGMRPGEYFDYPPLVAAPRFGFAWDINGRRQAGAAGLDRGVLRHPHARRLGRLRRRIRRRRSPAWSSGQTFAAIENFATSNIAFVETPDQRRSTPAARRGRSRSPTT